MYPKHIKNFFMKSTHLGYDNYSLSEFSKYLADDIFPCLKLLIL